MPTPIVQSFERNVQEEVGFEGTAAFAAAAAAAVVVVAAAAAAD